MFGSFSLFKGLFGVSEAETVKSSVDLGNSIQRILNYLNRRNLVGAVSAYQLGDGRKAKIEVCHVTICSLFCCGIFLLSIVGGNNISHEIKSSIELRALDWRL